MNSDKTYNQELIDLPTMNMVIRHKLRNLCAGIKMTINRISSQSQKIDPSISEKCTLINFELDMLDEFTHRMDLVFATLPACTKKSLASILDEVYKSFTCKFPLSSLSIGGPQLKLSLKRGKLIKIALSEVLNNAGEAIDSNSDVILCWEMTDNSSLKFLIKNTGAPIPSKIPYNPPKPFYTTKGKHDGLGLSIASRISAHINGSCIITSNTKNNITVEIIIPQGEFVDE